ncbi:integral membrane protein [Lactobacillus plantarum JDM1] [Leuconostoc pseudomesenteroides]|jgi:hypothetical protein|nr:integral membrane protein [Lactobacillus plantarum JDM1] [Leuconostoc pseudomesenteroides]
MIQFCHKNDTSFVHFYGTILAMDQDYYQQQNLSQRMPDGTILPRRLSTDARDKRILENFSPAKLKDWRFWVPLIVIVISLNLVWWRLPLMHTQDLEGDLTWALAPLFGYTITIAIGIALMMTQNFRSLLSYLFFAFSILFTFNSLIQARHEIWLLLLILVAFFIAVQQLWLGLQNILGLILLSVLATFTIPIAIFYSENNYLTQKFIIQLLPMLFAFFFYFTPIIMPNPDGRKLSLLSIGLFWAALLSHHVGATTIVIFILSMFAFVLQFVKARIGNWQNMIYVFLLALSMLLVYQ